MDQSTDRMIGTRSDPALQPAEDRPAVYDGGKPAHEIEEDIARTRVRLSATIEALEREMAPHRVIERGTHLLRGSLEPGPGPFRDQVWAYAVPLALIATGLGWLFILRRRSYEAESPSSFGEMPADAVETGQMPVAAPVYGNVVDPLEPVSLLDEKTEASSRSW